MLAVVRALCGWRPGALFLCRANFIPFPIKVDLSTEHRCTHKNTTNRKKAADMDWGSLPRVFRFLKERGEIKFVFSLKSNMFVCTGLLRSGDPCGEYGDVRASQVGRMSTLCGSHVWSSAAAPQECAMRPLRGYLPAAAYKGRCHAGPGIPGPITMEAAFRKLRSPCRRR